MKNLLNFFFSFDKLFKEKLIVPFFWLAIIVWGLGFFESFLAGINLGWLAFAVKIIGNIITVLLALVTFRLLSEIAIAIFRINDNLSPDGGKSELVDIDPVEEARKAAELAAARTREATRSVSEKASEATKSIRENVGEMSGNVQDKAKAATASVRNKASDLKTKQSPEKNKSEDKSKAEETKTEKTKIDIEDAIEVDPPKVDAKTTTTSKAKTTTSKTKTTTSKPKATKTFGKRGPKAGTKIPRDADGNLLKKDGTPRKKPGPKK